MSPTVGCRIREKGLVLGLAIFIFFASSGWAVARDLMVQSNWVEKETLAGMVRGEINVVVQNLTDHSLHNIDLRLDALVPGFIENNVLQIGTLPADGIQNVSGDMAVESAFMEMHRPLEWQVSFDDDQGNHHDFLVTEMIPLQ